MQITRITVIAVTMTVSLSGCGTVCNLAAGIAHPESEPRVYGGVQRDLEILDKMANNQVGVPLGNVHGGGASGAIFLAAILAIPLADPLLSFVGDTVTLPITVRLQHGREAAEDSVPTVAEDRPSSPGPPVSLGKPQLLDEPNVAWR